MFLGDEAHIRYPKEVIPHFYLKSDTICGICAGVIVIAICTGVCVAACNNCFVLF